MIEMKEKHKDAKNKLCFLNIFDNLKSFVFNETKMKKIKFSFVAVLFFCFHFYFYAPFVLLANEDGECLCDYGIVGSIECPECVENIECIECFDCFGFTDTKEASARAALDNEKPIKSCDEYLSEIKCKDEYSMEYGVFLITCFVMNGVALGMVLLGDKKRNVKEVAKMSDDKY